MKNDNKEDFNRLKNLLSDSSNLSLEIMFRLCEGKNIKEDDLEIFTNGINDIISFLDFISEIEDKDLEVVDKSKIIKIVK